MGVGAARWRSRSWPAVAALSAVLCSNPPTAAPADLPAFHVYIQNAPTAGAVRRTLKDAADRMETEGCKALLSEFSDASGTTLAGRLGELGTTPREYLSLVIFYDGTALRPCQDERRLAFTAPGNRAVFVCPRFRETATQDSLLAQALLIHEALHTLGLGENPPSSREVTDRVQSRCRRLRGETAAR